MPIGDLFKRQEGQRSAFLRRIAPAGLCLLIAAMVAPLINPSVPAPNSASTATSMQVPVAHCPAKEGDLRPVSTAKSFRAQLEIEAAGDLGHPTIVGRTNMPEGTEFVVTLSRAASKYSAQDKSVVDGDGCFSAGPFGQQYRAINAGRYDVDVSTGLFDLQAEGVQAILGAGGEYARGPAIREFLAAGRELGRGLDYKTTVALGTADVAKDRDARAAADLARDQQLTPVRERAALAVTRALRERLRNPTSADWMSVGTTQDANVVCIVLRAQNGFGGMSVEPYASIDDDIQAGSAAWNRHCAGKHLYDLTQLVRANQ